MHLTCMRVNTVVWGTTVIIKIMIAISNFKIIFRYRYVTQAKSAHNGVYICTLLVNVLRGQGQEQPSHSSVLITHEMDTITMLIYSHDTEELLSYHIYLVAFKQYDRIAHNCLFYVHTNVQQ